MSKINPNRFKKQSPEVGSGGSGQGATVPSNLYPAQYDEMLEAVVEGILAYRPLDWKSNPEQKTVQEMLTANGKISDVYLYKNDHVRRYGELVMFECLGLMNAITRAGNVVGGPLPALAEDLGMESTVEYGFHRDHPLRGLQDAAMAVGARYRANNRLVLPFAVTQPSTPSDGSPAR